MPSRAAWLRIVTGSHWYFGGAHVKGAWRPLLSQQLGNVQCAYFGIVTGFTVTYHPPKAHSNPDTLLMTDHMNLTHNCQGFSSPRGAAYTKGSGLMAWQ